MQSRAHREFAAGRGDRNGAVRAHPDHHHRTVHGRECLGEFRHRARRTRFNDTLPRNPRERFMNGAMQRSIFAGAAGLFAAVSLAFVWALWQGQSLVAAQTLERFLKEVKLPYGQTATLSQ